jgi:hypothetical protein
MTINQAAVRLFGLFSPEERSIPDSVTYPGRNAAVAGALNGAFQRLFSKEGPWVRKDTRAALIYAPTAVTVAVTNGSTSATVTGCCRRHHRRNPSAWASSRRRCCRCCCGRKHLRSNARAQRSEGLCAGEGDLGLAQLGLQAHHLCPQRVTPISRLPAEPRRQGTCQCHKPQVVLR